MVHKFHAKCNFVPLWQTKMVVIHWPSTSWRSHQSSWQFPRSSASSLRNQMISAKIQCSYTYYQWRCFQRRGAASVSNRGFEVEVKTLIGGEKWRRRTLSPRYAAVVQVSMSIFTKESMQAHRDGPEVSKVSCSSCCNPHSAPPIDISNHPRNLHCRYQWGDSKHCDRGRTNHIDKFTRFLNFCANSNGIMAIVGRSYPGFLVDPYSSRVDFDNS